MIFSGFASVCVYHAYFEMQHLPSSTSMSNSDILHIAVYFCSVKACCFEISVNVYICMYVWDGGGYNVKGERSAVTAGIVGG